MKIIMVLILLLANIINFNAYASDADEKHDHTYMVNDVQITMPELLTQKIEGDVVYGNEDAPVTIVEYASLSCSHCGNFHDQVFGDLETNYIKEGKVKLVYRHFPLNLPALQGALLVECFSDDDDKKKFIKSLFKTQGQWAFTQDFNIKLKNISRIAGLSEKQFNDCISDTAKEEALLAAQLKAQQGLTVRSTPALFINGKLYKGAKTVKHLSKYVDDLL